MRAKAGKAFGIERIKAARTLSGVEHEPYVLEHFQMLRNGGTRNGERIGDLVDGHGAFRKSLEDGHAGAVGKRVEPGL